MECDQLDVLNIIEVERIRKVLREHPDLLSMFEILIIISNNRINKKEIAVLSMPLEEDAEPVLSDHESDDEMTDES